MNSQQKLDSGLQQGNLDKTFELMNYQYQDDLENYAQFFNFFIISIFKQVKMIIEKLINYSIKMKTEELQKKANSYQAQQISDMTQIKILLKTLEKSIRIVGEPTKISILNSPSSYENIKLE
ncbi:hypothetical protein ABPG74_006804 [Tetrahymena malaccensis]